MAPGVIWEGTAQRTNRYFSDPEADTAAVSIISSDGVEFRIADYHLKSYR